MARHVPPFECDIVALGAKGQGLASGPRGEPVLVRGAPPGARVSVVVTGRKNGVLLARRTATLAPPPDAVEPRCRVFGTCGGCSLQELPLATQRRLKHELALRDALPGLGADVVVHPPRGDVRAYGYRNKIELSFGPHRWLTEADKDVANPRGSFLGFHAPGRFDRVVDLSRCELVSDAANAVIDVVRSELSAPDAPPTWDPKEHRGFWRHLLLREHGGRLLVALFTGDDATPGPVERLAERLAPSVAAFRWYVNRGVADVARGDLVRAWGVDTLVETLRSADGGEQRFEVSTTSFFQTNTGGTEVLYDTIAELCGRGGTLLDLYCGSGTIGQTLAHRFDRVVGVEENLEAVDDARRNAVRNGVPMEVHAARVEDVLEALLAAHGGAEGASVVVDPPRVGLHPKVVARLATVSARELVYVACHPASLGRDAVVLREGGWRATDLHTVDLFPQTGHVEAVARFVR